MNPLRALLILFVGAAVSLAAASPDSPGQLTAERTANANARAAARQGNVTLAEQLLSAVNRSTPNTAWWYFEIAQRLVHLAHDLPYQNNGTVIPAVVNRALQHLAQAESLTTVPRQRAAIKAFAGMVQEQFRGDHAAALASYRAASQLSPENQVAARAADRLQRTVDTVAARTRK